MATDFPYIIKCNLRARRFLLVIIIKAAQETYQPASDNDDDDDHHPSVVDYVDMPWIILLTLQCQRDSTNG